MPLLRDNSRVECFLDVAIKDDDAPIGRTRIQNNYNKNFLSADYDDESNSIIYDSQGWSNNNVRQSKGIIRSSSRVDDVDTDDTQSCNTSSGSEEDFDEIALNNNGNNNDDNDGNKITMEDDRSYCTTSNKSHGYDAVPQSDNDDQDDHDEDDDDEQQNNVALEQEMAAIKFELAEARAQVDWYKLKFRNLNIEIKDLQAFCKQLQDENTELRNERTVAKFSGSNTNSNASNNNNNSNSYSSSALFKNYSLPKNYSLWGRSRSKRDAMLFVEDPKKTMTTKDNNNNNDADGNTALDCSWDTDTIVTSPTIDDSNNNDISKSRHSTTSKPRSVTVRNSDESSAKTSSRSGSKSMSRNTTTNNQIMSEIIIQTPQTRPHKTITAKGGEKQKLNRSNKTNEQKGQQQQQQQQRRRSLNNTAPIIEVPPAILKQSKQFRNKAQRRLSNSSTASSVKIQTPLGRMKISETTQTTKQHNPHLFDVELDDDDEFSSDYLSFGGSYYKHCSVAYQQQQQLSNTNQRINEDIEEEEEEEPSIAISALSMVMPPTTSIPIDLSTDCTIVSETTRYSKSSKRGSHKWRKGLKLQ